MLRLERNPKVDYEAPTADGVTLYDEQHLITYLRLLDANAEGADWREVVRIVLRLDPEGDPPRVKRCWRSHLDRAIWMTEHGYRHLLALGAEDGPRTHC